MLDDATTGASADLPRCPWCSSVLPSNEEVSCRTCGATLVGEGDANLPGVTAIDAAAILSAARTVKAKPRSRLMSWISGDYDETAVGPPPPPGSLEPPSGDVRREMLRLELEAQVANLQAEAGAMAADAALESGEILETPDVAAVVEATAAEITALAEAEEAAAEVSRSVEAGPAAEERQQPPA